MKDESARRPRCLGDDRADFSQLPITAEGLIIGSINETRIDESSPTREAV